MRPPGRHWKFLVLAVAAVNLATAGYVAATIPPPGFYNIRVSMLPPVDALGNKACLTQDWHEPVSAFDDNRALDWKAGNSADTSCTFSGTEIVRFRALVTSTSETPYDGTYWPALSGAVSQLPNNNCPGGGTVHLAKVKIIGIDSNLEGFMVYAHALAYGSNNVTFTIQARKGGTRGQGYLTSVGVADTVADGPSNCWTGWHVHEVNSDDADMQWDGWNSTYNNVTPPSCNCYVNNSSANWTRQMDALILIGE